MGDALDSFIDRLARKRGFVPHHNANKTSTKRPHTSIVDHVLSAQTDTCVMTQTDGSNMAAVNAPELSLHYESKSHQGG